MKKLYIQPNMQLQSMHTTSLVCASGGRSITNNAGLELVATQADSLDPM